MRTVLLAFVLAACASADDLPRPIVRDSAGIAIVENVDLAPDPAWSNVGIVPDLEIGEPGAVEFGQIVDLEIGSTGHFYVVDQIDQAVRVFSPDGAPLLAIGRPGEGPGEFSRFVNGAFVADDTVFVTDWGSRRMSRFSTTGDYLGHTDLPTPPGARSWWRQVRGSVYARVLRRIVEDGRWTGDDILIRASGTTADTIMRFDYTPTDIGGPEGLKAALIINTPSWAVLPDGAIAWTALDLGEVRVHRADGTRVGILRHSAWSTRPATPGEQQHLTSLLGDRLERLGGTRTSIPYLDIPPVETLPVLTSVLAGPAGSIWVQRAAEPADYHLMAINAPELPWGFGGPLWDVFDASGAFLTTLTLPDGLQPLRIRGDTLYGVQRDGLGVERVVRMRIEGLPDG